MTPSNTRFFYKGEDGQPVALDATVVRTHTAQLKGSLVSRHVQKRQEHVAKFQKRSEVARSLGKRATQFANCSPTQEAQIQRSVYVASLYVAQAEKFLTLNTQTSRTFLSGPRCKTLMLMGFGSTLLDLVRRVQHGQPRQCAQTLCDHSQVGRQDVYV